MIGRQWFSRVLVLILIIALGAGVYAYSVIKSVPKMFKLNEELKSEGYYMAEFEFKMLGCAYYLDKGQYVTALFRLAQMNHQLKSREGLVKIPQFKDKKEELEFYRSLQNPRTGAFMDDSYPLFTYIGPTLNVMEKMQSLSQEVGEPLQLKNPIKFLDEIDTPEELKAFLDDLSTVGWLGAKFRTPYVAAAELAESATEIAEFNLYSFSPEWKQALLQWFYSNQDPKTGYWGVKSRSGGSLLDGGDLNSSEKILKLFVDMKGNNRYPEFPLRYKEQLFASTLQKLSKPMPQDLDEVHEWTLVMNRGTRLLTRYLWGSATPEQKAEARELMEKIVRSKYETTFIPAQGAFSYYPGAANADLDGTGETLGYLNEIGALSSTKQRELWGSPENSLKDLGNYRIWGLQEIDFDLIKNTPGINSIRLYRIDPGIDFDAGVAGIYYPNKTAVIDACDLLYRLDHWANITPQSMGNWVSKESIFKELAGFHPNAIPVYNETIPLNLANEVLRQDHVLVIVGFDVLQKPVCKMTFLHLY
ncbi:MAG: hypothetical protein ABFD04_08505 [Syntrophomonas sp.]